LSGARNHDTLSRQNDADKKETEMYSIFENFEIDDVIASVFSIQVV